MTQTAKTLVLLNLVLSVVFVAWAVGLLTNEVPWNTPPAGEGPKVEGMIAQLQARIKELTLARNSADQRWGEAYADLQKVEAQRAEALKYETDLLRSVREGTVPDVKPPVQQLEYGPNNTLLLKVNGRPPVTINDASALSLAGYHAKIQDTLKEIQAAQADVDKLVKETEELTLQINGRPYMNKLAPTPDEKGLRVRIRETHEMVHDLQLEEQYLRSPLTYYMLQRDQLRQRQAALTARLGELRAAVTAAR